MRILVIFLIVTLLGLQTKLWIGAGSLAQWMQLEKKLAKQEQDNKLFLARNRAIEADIVELKSGDQALEEQARFELGMVKEGESYYQFVE
jgi:cell division protein FtsB